MILIDFSQFAIASLSHFFEDIKKDPKDAEGIGRHAILAKIASIRHKFREYGEVVICVDGENYWRKDIFPYYKASRKTAREESDIPWKEIHAIMDLVREELAEHSPYKVIQHDKAEADDLIGILVKLCNSRLVPVGLDMDSEPVIIQSRDGDMKQLLTNPNVKQYDPMYEKYLKLDMPVKEFLRRKILTGDAGDGIPNCFSPVDSFVTKTRQKPCTEKRMAPLLECANMADGTDDEAVKDRIDLNEQLISFAKIPRWLEEEVLEMYSQKPKGNKMSLFKYLGDKRCTLLMEDINKF